MHNLKLISRLKSNNLLAVPFDLFVGNQWCKLFVVRHSVYVIVMSDSLQYLCTVASYNTALHPEPCNSSLLTFTFDPILSVQVAQLNLHWHFHDLREAWTLMYSRCFWRVDITFTCYSTWCIHGDLILRYKCALCKYGKSTVVAAVDVWLHTPTESGLLFGLPWQSLHWSWRNTHNQLYFAPNNWQNWPQVWYGQTIYSNRRSRYCWQISTVKFTGRRGWQWLLIDQLMCRYWDFKFSAQCFQLWLCFFDGKKVGGISSHAPASNVV